MLDICADYAGIHNILFHPKESVCMVILPTPFKYMILPDIILCDIMPTYVDSYKYLGYHISNSCSKSDDLELRHQYSLLCCRSNSLIRKSSMCSYDVKRFLYSTYCSSVSCVYLWHSYHVYVLRKCMIRNVFRI